MGAGGDGAAQLGGGVTAGADDLGLVRRGVAAGDGFAGEVDEQLRAVEQRGDGLGVAPHGVARAAHGADLPPGGGELAAKMPADEPRGPRDDDSFHDCSLALSANASSTIGFTTGRREKDTSLAMSGAAPSIKVRVRRWSPERSHTQNSTTPM